MTFEAERQQLRYDFRHAPAVARYYFPSEEVPGSVKMIRQINGVNTYLSAMATGEARFHEGFLYAVAIAGMDVVTDYHQEPLNDGALTKALGGNPPYRCLAPVEHAADAARSERFASSLRRVAKFQDKSLTQFDSPEQAELHNITYMKGGYSALAHLHAVKGNSRPSEEDLMMRFGYVMQLLDDYLDRPDDAQDGISTLFTEGHFDYLDLKHDRSVLLDKLEEEYGPSGALARFRKLTRFHMTVARTENATSLPVSSLVPWYL